MLSILIIEDAKRFYELLKKGLSEEGYLVEVATDGETGLRLAQTGDFDLVLLDINLPKMDGFTLIKALREARSDVPVIMTTARDSIEDRIFGLDGGADDYLVKPFEFKELLARIRAVIRRNGSRKEAPLRYGEVYIDSAQGKAWVGETMLPLTPKEFDLLRVFLQNPEKTISRKELEQEAWQSIYDGTSNRIDVYVNYLRNKLHDADAPQLIHTIRGEGYRFTDKI